MSATPDPEMEYLQPDFDPNSLTMPKLRGIFVAHSVNYPSTAKKGELVDIFEEQVRPQARKLLSARSRTKRSTRGIEDMPSSTEPSVADEYSDEEPLPTRPPQWSARRTTRLASEKTTPAPPSSVTRAGQPRASVSRASEESTATESSRKPSTDRRTRLSTATPSVKIEEEDDEEPYRGDRRKSAFTSENVFQSGSSPATELETSRVDRRRRTTEGDAHDKKKRSSSKPKKMLVAKSVEPRRPFRATTSPEADQDGKDERDEPDAGEEFTPEEAQELVSLQESGTAMRAARPKQTRPKGTIAKIAPLALVVAISSGVFTIWRQEKIAVGFCGVGRPAMSYLGDVEIPAWARDSVLPTCEPCPPHAYCHSDLKVQCEDDFMLTPHPLSIGGLVPLSPTCEPDGEKARKVQAVADRVVEELRERNAKVECGELKDETTGKKIDNAAIEEPELKAAVSSKRQRRMSQTEFEELWHSAIGDVMARDEVVDVQDASTSTSSPRKLRSTSLARVPFTCALRRSLRLALVRHLRLLIISLIFLSSLYYIYSTLLSRREMETRAKQLAGFALDSLATQAAWANYYGDEPGEDGGTVERYIGSAQLRDDVLREEFSASRRKKLWERVQKKVEENANVRSAVREGRSGEVGRVWEWIGAVGALDFGDEDGRAGSRPVSRAGVGRRKSERFSLGAARYAESSPLSGSTPLARPTGLQPWEEGRPIY